jgi:transposase
MAMVCGLDLHRRQITFDALETGSGVEWRGRIWQPERERFGRWLRSDLTRRANGEGVALAVEGCTGWRFVVEEIQAAGFDAHLAEPADTQAARGRKHRAKTDRSDARLLRELLAAGELPASWIPPAGVLEWRERVRLYVSLVNQRTVWCQRIHAELYQHGVAVPEGAIRTAATRSILADRDLALSPAGRQRITVSYRMIDATDAEALPLKKELQRFGARQPACRALADAQYGIGRLIAVAGWSELGDCRRFSRSDQAVRHTGLDCRWTPPIGAAPAGSCPGKATRRCAGRCTRRPRTPRTCAAPTTTSTRRSRPATTARSSPPRFRCPNCTLPVVAPQAGPTLLPRAAPGPSRRGLRDPGLNITAGRDGRDRPSEHQGQPRSAPTTGVPASVRAGRPSNTDPTALPPRGSPDQDCCRRRHQPRRAPR